MMDTTMGWLDRLRGPRRDPATERLYDAVVAQARAEHWYLAGAVPDTVDGRFEMVASVLALVLLRLEGVPEAATASAQLTETFIEDMDGQLRQIGIGDVVVGKKVGKMMGLLGGRLGVLRDGVTADAVLRNVYRGVDPGASPLAHTVVELDAFATRLAATPTDRLLAGALP